MRTDDARRAIVCTRCQHTHQTLGRCIHQFNGIQLTPSYPGMTRSSRCLCPRLITTKAAAKKQSAKKTRKKGAKSK